MRRCLNNIYRANLPELADVIIYRDDISFNYKDLSPKNIRERGHTAWMMSNKSMLCDTESFLSFLKSKNIINVVPCSELCDKDAVLTLLQKYPHDIFQLLRLQNGQEEVLEENTLDSICNNNTNTCGLPSVIFSKEAKYFVRLKKDVTHVIGFFGNIDGSCTFTTDKIIDKHIHTAILNVFGRFSGFFSVDFYCESDRTFIYSFNAKLTEEHISDKILSIDHVKNMFNRISQRHKDIFI